MSVQRERHVACHCVPETLTGLPSSGDLRHMVALQLPLASYHLPYKMLCAVLEANSCGSHTICCSNPRTMQHQYFPAVGHLAAFTPGKVGSLLVSHVARLGVGLPAPQVRTHLPKH